MRYAFILMMSLVVLGLAGCGEATVDIGEEFDAAAASPDRQVIFATRDGDLGTMKALLEQYPAAITGRDHSGNSLLHHAAMASQIGSAKLLLEKGADINAVNADDLTPLSAAYDRNATPEMIAFLEEQGGVE